MIDVSLITSPHLWAVIMTGIALYTFKKAWRSKITKTPQHAITSSNKHSIVEYSENAYYQIEPLPDFNLETTEPIKIRPFKPKYHLTMAIENIAPSDLLAFDKTYPSRIALRTHLLRTHRSDVLALNPPASPAVLELYAWLTSTYLPTRLPTLFSTSPSGLKNHTTGTTLPLTPPSAPHALHLLGTNIDTDFLFLLPSPDPPGEPKYRLEAFVTCFPSGFDTRAKLGLKLADIHGPVPGYAEKLERSMDRFFAGMPVGRVVRRANWSVTTNRDLFCPAGNHGSEDEFAEGRGEGLQAEVDVGETVLRCERQTLHRLPRSGALVFAFKTYQYGLAELRGEAEAEALAEAIEGLGRGSVPGMQAYKRSVVWGERVKEFLRKGV